MLKIKNALHLQGVFVYTMGNNRLVFNKFQYLRSGVVADLDKINSVA